MVRLETSFVNQVANTAKKFTFQYGQIRNKIIYCIISKIKNIYIPVWLDQKRLLKIIVNILGAYLHSSMVRLETKTEIMNEFIKNKFTFQYGQIRN